jgi:ferredoxin-type protein NapG
LNRRHLLGGTVAAVAGFLGGVRTRQSRSNRLRPPGAQPNGGLEEKCIRCFRCAEVCPPKAIRLDAVWDPAGSDLPYIEAKERACVLCMKCTQACPTGALAPIVADLLTVHGAVRMGTPVLTRDRCISWRGVGICRLCYYVCPYPDQAVALVGRQQSPLFEPKQCVGCGLCEEACPSIAKAIRILPLT